MAKSIAHQVLAPAGATTTFAEPPMEHIKIVDIDVDVNQPRKYFDKEGMKELQDSIAVDGVLQPIAVRLNPGKGRKYLLIMGERRWRAAAGVCSTDPSKNTIPAMIRVMDDDQALHAQLVENLQRVNPHPLEEAIAFDSLVNGKGKKHSVEEVAHLVGKTPFFVRQRIKLASLRKNWQDIFFKNKMNITQAVLISRMSAADQEHFYTKLGRITQKWIDNPDTFLEIDEDDIERMQGNLLKAPFDTKDPTLSPKFGPCDGCPFNTATQSLFPEDAKNPMCMNREDYALKSKVSFDRRLKEVMEDPAVILVHDYIRNVEDEKLYSRLKKEGHKLYRSSEDVVKKGDYNYDYASSGPEVRGFWINDDKKGTFSTFRHKKSSTNTSNTSKSKTDEKLKAGKLTKADVTEEVKRIAERETRNKELDLVKVHKAILADLHAGKKDIMTMKHQGSIDRGIMIYILINFTESDYQFEERRQMPWIPKEPSRRMGYSPDYIKSLSKVTDDQLAQFIRHFALHKWGNEKILQDVHTQDTPLMMIAQYAGIDIKGHQAAQNEVATKRNHRAKSRKDSLMASVSTKKVKAKK